MKEDMPVGL